MKLKKYIRQDEEGDIWLDDKPSEHSCDNACYNAVELDLKEYQFLRKARADHFKAIRMLRIMACEERRKYASDMAQNELNCVLKRDTDPKAKAVAAVTVAARYFKWAGEARLAMNFNEIVSNYEASIEQNQKDEA